MVRVVDYDSRRKEILRKTIEYYLETAEPVSSDALLDNYKLDFSSATIRSVLKDLEGKGYLAHTHTSSGRIPTDLGYRFYIDDLMHKMDLSKEEKSTLKKFFNSYLQMKRSVLENSTRIISNFTHYVGIVNDEDQHRIYYSGWSHLLEQPEFRDVGKIHSIFKALEEDRLLDLMNRQMQEPVEVLIGEECDCPEMSNCALIIADCSNKNRKLGKLAVLGPKRMAYSRVMPMVDYLSELIIEEFE
ncbi:HrcA family transcriptional regulator [Candidatus Omnitrophota bacterium]